jgi:hypothetical protein
MESKSVRSWFASSLLRDGALWAMAGWAGALALVNFTEPFIFPRWLFFFCLLIAFAGTALPLAWYLNRRFSPDHFPPDGILWREAMEVAVLGNLLVWLQVGRMLNAALGWIFFIVFLAVEILLRIYEESRWVPANAKPVSSTRTGSAMQSDPVSNMETDSSIH